MSSWIAVSRTEHANKHWRPRSGYEFAAAEQAVSVVVAELSKLLPHYAMGFLQAEDGTYQLIALLGLGSGQNLYVTDNHQWLCSYVPAAMRVFPFALHNDSQGNRVFCVYDTHLSDDDSLPRLVNADGELDKLVAKSLDFITHCEQNRLVTTTACAALASAGVIEPWPVSINLQHSQEPLQINGLCRINEEALGKLDADVFVGLRTSGALVVAYAQLFSIAQLEQLTQRAEYLVKEKLKMAPAEGLDTLFSGDDAGSLNFDSL